MPQLRAPSSDSPPRTTRVASTSSPPRAPTSAAILQNRAFIELSRVLASCDSAVLSTALPFIVHGADLSSGAIYTYVREELSLVASEGAPLRLRAYLEEPELTDAHDFLVRRAIKQRRTVASEAAFGLSASEAARAAQQEAGWQCVIAIPILAGGESIGALLLGARAATIEGGTLMFLEAMANVLGAALGKPSAEPTASQGTVACAGCVALGSEALAALGRDLSRIHTLTRDLCNRPQAPPEADALMACSRAVERDFRRLSELVMEMPLTVCSHGKRAVPMAGVVDVAVHAAQPSLASARAELTVACAPACEVLGDADLLTIAIRHVVVNAAESFQAARERNETLSTPRLVRIVVRTEGSNAAIHIEDSGPGIPADLRARVFDPAFTTKGPGRGLGLSVARHVVAAHGGWMEIGASELGGTRVSVLIPARAAALMALRTAPTLPSVPVPGARRSGPPSP
ncbi:MAG: ATP-binding protein [Polyangiaceae bacterium]